MNINAAPRAYTSSIVADADLNLEGYNMTADAVYSKDNYLLSMLDYGEAFPTDVQEGDKVFKWGADSTKSYIYTYKQGAWDQGVKPQHMQDYYIADENRTVRFCLLRSSGSYFSMFYGRYLEDYLVDYHQLLTFEPNVFILGSIDLYLKFAYWGSGSGISSLVVPASSYVRFNFTDCTTLVKGNIEENIGGISLSRGSSKFISVVVPSGVNAFNSDLCLYSFSIGDGGAFIVGVCYEFDV